MGSLCSMELTQHGFITRKDFENVFELPEIGPEVTPSLDFWSVHFLTMVRTQVWASEDPSIIQAVMNSLYDLRQVTAFFLLFPLL